MPTTLPWWKKAVVYQIYPKSFYDTTGNGVGDLNGIIEKLPYLEELGVDVIWLTPIYTSPQNDNGYDISDYKAIHEPYGTMADFEQLLAATHSRGIKIIMDLVVNHTSTEHEWFQQASVNKESPYRDFYIWKEAKENGEEPTNWISKFGGSAWQWDEETKEYYLHLFDVTQADLNWENEKVRQAIYEMMHFWFAKGIDGFRLDVINLISKDQRFPDDDGSAAPGDGRKFYTDGPRVHDYLREMNDEVFSRYDALTVGEMSSTTLKECVRYTHPDSHELAMTFNFHHLKVDYPNGEKWAVAPFDFAKLKQILSEWQIGMQEGGGWNATFWCNHDQPRIVSRFGNDGKYHQESAKMLATAIHLLQGTPYIYQGEEIGMTNPSFTSIDQYRDVESLNMYEKFREKGVSEEEILHILQHKSRDNSRTPMQWSSEQNGGFTTGIPWIPVAKNADIINVEASRKDPDSIYHHYRKLIQLRKKYETITTGTFRWHLQDNTQLYVYTRTDGDETFVVVNNFYSEETTFDTKELFQSWEHSELILSNYHDTTSFSGQLSIRPYESVVYRLQKPVFSS